MKQDVYAERYEQVLEEKQDYMEMPMFHQKSRETAAPDMGLVPAGLLRHEIYQDEYGIDAWDQDNRYLCFIHLAIACKNAQSPDIGRHINRRLP